MKNGKLVKREEVIDTYTKKQEGAQGQFNTMLKRLEKSGCLSGNNDDMFTTSANLMVYKQIIDGLTHNAELTYGTLMAWVKDRVRQKAMHPQFSTSATSNLYEQCENAAWASFLYFMEARYGDGDNMFEDEFKSAVKS